MNIITEPTVTIISRPAFVDHPQLDLPTDGDDCTRIGAFAAKTCYRSFGESGRSNEDNQRAIIASHHGRILEHINIGVHIAGISRALGNELITHKAGLTVSQESTRYVSMEDANCILEPYMADLFHQKQTLELPEDDPRLHLLIQHLESFRDSLMVYEEQYQTLIELGEGPGGQTARRKWARGKARNVLPLSLGTSMVVTANLRAWRHLIEIRSERHAESEIRRLAFYLFNLLEREAPLYFDDYTFEVVDGYPEYSTSYRKI